jgi:hypothetical protein
MTLRIIPRVWRSSSVNVLEDLSFYQVLIEQRDQIAEYRNESRKRARHMTNAVQRRHVHGIRDNLVLKILDITFERHRMIESLCLFELRH